MRVEFDAAEPSLREWVRDVLGEDVRVARTQSGGFSAGIASRLETASGRTAFLKAVGPEPNPQTGELFRHEIRVLRMLPAAPYRASLLDSYDDGVWVALLVEDVPGRLADFGDPADHDAVRRAVRAQSQELTPDPIALDVPDLAAAVTRWSASVEAVLDRDPSHFPPWFVAERAAVLARFDELARAMDAGTWIHLDVRPDNVLVRPDGTPVLVDWGMSRSGPWWADEALLAIGAPSAVSVARTFDDLAAYDPGRSLPSVRRDHLDTFALAVGASLASFRDHPVPGLPAIDRFRRQEAARLLAVAGSLLGAT